MAATATKQAAIAAKQSVKSLRQRVPLFQRRALAGAPVNASYEQVSVMGTPADANGLDRARDSALAFFVRFSALFNALAVFAVAAMVFFGVMIAVVMIGVLFGVDNGAWAQLSPACTNLTNVTKPATSSVLPEVNGVAIDVGHCTTNQFWFASCIKAFNFIFSYINFLPIVWRLSILVNTTHGRPGKNDELVDGVDFYNRPTEALWFHLPRRKRKQIAFLLNLAWVFHFGAMAMHITYWSYAAGQVLPGAVLQNVPFVLSVASAIAAGVIQGNTEKAIIRANPGRFPPDPMEYVKGAYRRWRAGGGKRSLLCGLWCAPCSPSFLALLREEMDSYKRDAAQQGVKKHALSGVTVHNGSGSEGPASPSATF